MKVGHLLRDVGRPVAYYPKLVPITGSTNATILLCQFLYWEGKQHDEDGWIYKTQADINEETGLTRYEQEGARKKLRESGILEEKRSGIPAKLYFRVDHDKLHNLWESQARMQKTPIQGGSDEPEQDAENSHSLTSTETTSKTTQRKKRTPPRQKAYAEMTADERFAHDERLKREEQQARRLKGAL